MKNNKIIVLISLLYIGWIASFSQASAADNPFGMGAAFGEWNLPIDANLRELQLRQTLYLAGPKGHVRLWCHPSTAESRAACSASINRAYDLNLIPIVKIQFNQYADDSTSPHVVYKNMSNQLAGFVNELPLRTDRNLLVELFNEPNYTDMWFSRTCNWVTRAKEVAQASAQLAQAIRNLNKTQIKILFTPLSPYSDSNPITNSDGSCGRGDKINLSSRDFVREMKIERPDLFNLIDAWNSHPYPSEDFGLCQKPNCPSMTTDPALVAYKGEMEQAGMPLDFPVYLTEVGTYFSISSQATADRFVQSSNSSLGIYPQLWLSGGPRNNVKGILGFILPLPGYNFYSFLDSCGAVTASAPYQTPNPIYTQIRNLRIKLLGNTPFAPSGTLTLPKSALKCSFKASLDFSGEQGRRQWSYVNGANSIPMIFDPINYRWQGSELYSLIWNSGFHPGVNTEVTRRWKAVKSGTALVSASALDVAPGCGANGVSVYVKKNGTILWQKVIHNEISGYFNLTVGVLAGDKIDFTVKSNGNNGCDSTALDPQIEFTARP
ncbi:MAG: hypothetical protein AABY64_13725 [Bdellovibrionota bacterium]